MKISKRGSLNSLQSSIQNKHPRVRADPNPQNADWHADSQSEGRKNRNVPPPGSTSAANRGNRLPSLQQSLKPLTPWNDFSMPELWAVQHPRMCGFPHKPPRENRTTHESGFNLRTSAYWTYKELNCRSRKYPFTLNVHRSRKCNKNLIFKWSVSGKKKQKKPNTFLGCLFIDYVDFLYGFSHFYIYLFFSQKPFSEPFQEAKNP